MIKTIGLSLFLILFLTACTPRIGAGVGGVVISGDGIAASEVIADSKTGIHGSTSIGSDTRF